MYPRNAASPEPIAIGAVVQISDGVVQTSGCTVRIKPIGVAEGDGAGTTAYSTDGIVLYTPTQGETNYTSFILIAKKTGCIPVSVTVVTSASSTPGTVEHAGTIKTLDALDTAQDTQHGTTQTAIADVPTVSEFNARTLAAADYFDPATDTVAQVTLVATTSTVTDGAKSATALSTVTWTGTLATNIGTTNSTVATNLNATITSRMATWTPPTGFLAATFPTTVGDATAANQSTLLDRLTSSRAGYLDNLNVGGAVASNADILALNQSASRRILLTTVGQYERPESGSTVYTVEARTFDGDGAATNADSNPTLTGTGQTTGSLAANIGTISNPATGVYRWAYTVASGATIEPIRFDISATMTSAFTLSVYAQVVDFVSATWTSTDASKLTSIYNKLPSSDYLTGTASSNGSGYATPTNVSDAQTAIITQVDANEAKIDTLTTNLATVDGIVNSILLDTAEIGSAGAGLTALAQSSIWTSTLATNIGTTNSTVATNLNATISSRSSHTAANVLSALGTGTWATAIPWNAAWDAEVQSEVQDAIEVNHLDHLLAVDYDPASKPGVSTALLNEIIGNDAGVSQFTANALELGPSGGGGGLDAAGVRAAVGLASANLDTQLADIPTVSEFNARTIPSNNYFDPATDTVANVTTVATTTNLTNLPAITTNWLTAAGLASDAVAEIQSGLATSASIAALNNLSAAQVNAEVDTAIADAPPTRITKNVALANFPFLMILASDDITPATGLTVTATRSIDGAAFAACANAVTEISNGWYKISLAASDLNGDTIALRFAAATANDRNITIVTQST